MKDKHNTYWLADVDNNSTENIQFRNTQQTIHNTLTEEPPITSVATDSARWKTSTNGKITSGRCQALAFALLLFLLLTNTSLPISRCNLASNSSTRYCSFKSSWTRLIYFSSGTDLYQILGEAIFTAGMFSLAVVPFFSSLLCFSQQLPHTKIFLG